MPHEFISIFTIIDMKLSNGPNYCSSTYWLWEDITARPALEILGYERITFYTGEQDSFGLLSRVARAYKGGRCYELIYG